MKKLTKKQVINYLIDVMGYDEDQARQEVVIYGVREALGNPERLQDCINYNQ